VVMVIVFVVCNTTRFVPNVMELFIEQDHFPKVMKIFFIPEKHPTANDTEIKKSSNYFHKKMRLWP